VSDPGKFHVEREDTDFRTELNSFKKKYFGRKRKPLRAFDTLLEGIFDSLETNPRNTQPSVRGTRARPEKWPKGSYQEHLGFWKLMFQVPGQAGDAGQGRLMYQINFRSNSVLPLMIYTHKDHTKRPPDDEIKRVLERHSD